MAISNFVDINFSWYALINHTDLELHLFLGSVITRYEDFPVFRNL